MDRQPWNVFLVGHQVICEPCVRHALAHPEVLAGTPISGPFTLQPLAIPLICGLGSRCLRVPEGASMAERWRACFLGNPLDGTGRRLLAERIYDRDEHVDFEFLRQLYQITPRELAAVGCYAPPSGGERLVLFEATALHRLNVDDRLLAATLVDEEGRAIVAWGGRALETAIADGLLDASDLHRSAYQFALRFASQKPN